MVAKNKTRVFIALTVLLSIIWKISCASEKNKKGVYLGDITLPPGFAINIYATNVENARSLAFGDSGTLFVGTRSVA